MVGSRPDLETLRERVRPIFARYPEIAAAYLFGSLARGTARPDSDADIGLVLRERGGTALDHYRMIAEVASRLEGVLGPAVADVVLLEPQGPIFCHRVLSEGLLLYEADRERRIDFVSETYVRYFDFLPTYRLATRGKIEAIRRWLRTRL